MGRKYIDDEHFISDRDGDSDPDHSQTVYRDRDGGPGACEKIDRTWDPSTGEWNDDD